MRAVSYKVVGYTRLWINVKYLIYSGGFSYIMGWIVGQNKALIHMHQYLDIVIMAWVTMCMATLCWAIGVAGIITQWQKELNDG